MWRRRGKRAYSVKDDDAKVTLEGLPMIEGSVIVDELLLELQCQEVDSLQWAMG